MMREIMIYCTNEDPMHFFSKIKDKNYYILIGKYLIGSG